MKISKPKIPRVTIQVKDTEKSRAKTVYDTDVDTVFSAIVEALDKKVEE